MMDHYLDLILDVEVVDKREAGETSSLMENMGCKRILERTIGVLNAQEQVTDASSVIIKMVRDLKEKKKTYGKATEGNTSPEEENKLLSQISFNDITDCINICLAEEVKYIVSPYESDAQKAHLLASGEADFAVTEDSDLLFWCGGSVYKALHSEGFDVLPSPLVIVVSPLSSIVRDQVAFLRSLGLKATFIGESDKQDKDIIKGNANAQLLYGSPEAFVGEAKFREMFSTPHYRQNVVAVVCDEVHTVIHCLERQRNDQPTVNLSVRGSPPCSSIRINFLLPLKNLSKEPPIAIPITSPARKAIIKYRKSTKDNPGTLPVSAYGRRGLQANPSSSLSEIFDNIDSLVQAVMMKMKPMLIM
ncbi:hypothetical protein ACROYT_G015233 [Oculina patagonica]